VRIFLIDLIASIVISIGLWEFRLAHRIWPGHPMLATGLVVAVCCIALHRALSPHNAPKGESKG